MSSSGNRCSSRSGAISSSGSDQAGEIRPAPDGPNDQPIGAFAYNRLVGIQLKLTRDAQGLIPAIAKEADMTF
jgi:hypothetical protein